jgi:hypothetical protein
MTGTKPVTVAELRDGDVAYLAWAATHLWEGVFGLAGVRRCGLESAVGRAEATQPKDASLWLPVTDAVYVAVRGKRHPVLWRKSGELRHGINVADWGRFARLREGDRGRAYVAVFEAFADEQSNRWSGAMLIQSLHKLGEPYKGFGPMADTAFWPRNRFCLLGSCPTDLLAAVSRGESMPDDWKPALLGMLAGGSPDPAQLSMF